MVGFTTGAFTTRRVTYKTELRLNDARSLVQKGVKRWALGPDGTMHWSSPFRHLTRKAGRDIGAEPKSAPSRRSQPAWACQLASAEGDGPDAATRARPAGASAMRSPSGEGAGELHCSAAPSAWVATAKQRFRDAHQCDSDDASLGTTHRHSDGSLSTWLDQHQADHLDESCQRFTEDCDVACSAADLAAARDMYAAFPAYRGPACEVHPWGFSPLCTNPGRASANQEALCAALQPVDHGWSRQHLRQALLRAGVKESSSEIKAAECGQEFYR